MVDIYLLLFILSFIFQTILSKRHYGHLFNPVFIFNILFFLHNWSFSLSKLLDHSLSWSTPTNNELYQPSVLFINLLCLWAFFLGCIMFYRPKKLLIKNRTVYSINIYLKLYYIFTLIFSMRVLINFMSGIVYGEGQASNAQEAYNPVQIVLASRVIWGSITLINTKNKKHLIIILITEIILSILSGGRKSLIILLISGILPRIEYLKTRFNAKYFIKFFSLLLLLGYFTVFIIFFRSTSSISSGLQERVKEANTMIIQNSSHFAFIALNSANSEGVQNWTFQLVSEGELKQLYGLSYLQSLINMIVLRPYQGELANYQAAYYFKSVAYPEINNHGWDFSFTAESILNWGYFGFISYLVLGIFISYLYYKKRVNQYYSTFYFLLFAILFICMRTDSTSLMRYISFYILSFPIFRFFGLIKKRKILNS